MKTKTKAITFAINKESEQRLLEIKTILGEDNNSAVLRTCLRIAYNALKIPMPDAVQYSSGLSAADPYRARWYSIPQM